MLSTYFNLVDYFMKDLAHGPISALKMREHYQPLTYFGIIPSSMHTPLTIDEVREIPFDTLRMKDPLIPFYIADFRLEWNVDYMNAYIDAVNGHEPFTWDEMVPDVATYKRLNRANANAYLNHHMKHKKKNSLIEAIHNDIELWKEAVLGSDQMAERVRFAYYEQYPELMIALFESMAKKGMVRSGNGVRTFFTLNKYLPNAPEEIRDYFYQLYHDALSGARALKNKEWLLNDDMPMIFLLKESLARGETDAMATLLIKHKDTVSLREFEQLPMMVLPETWVDLVSFEELAGKGYSYISSFATLPNNNPVLWKTFLDGNERWQKALLCFWIEKIDPSYGANLPTWQEVNAVINVCGGRTVQAVEMLLTPSVSYQQETEIYLP